METVELMAYSLGNALEILGQVTADLTQEQADWTPPGIANPIGGLYWHTLSGADAVVFRWVDGQPPLYEREGWRERVVIVADEDPQADTKARIDLAAAHEYAAAVGQTIQEWLGTLTPEDLERTIELEFGTYSVAQMLSLFVVWHIDVHCGEISALKGCQGAKGYPF